MNKTILVLSLLFLILGSACSKKESGLSGEVVGTYLGTVSGTTTGNQSNYIITIESVDETTITISSNDVDAFEVDLIEDNNAIVNEIDKIVTTNFTYTRSTQNVSVARTSGSFSFTGTKQVED